VKVFYYPAPRHALAQDLAGRSAGQRRGELEDRFSRNRLRSELESGRELAGLAPSSFGLFDFLIAR
jgi:hypothetical protein